MLGSSRSLRGGPNENVYFSTESSVMVQISKHCHASISHPVLDTKGTGRTPPAVSAAEWHTRRRSDTYRSKPMDVPLHRPFRPPVSHYLHASSPQNLRKSSDIWGFSTENNQVVRRFNDPHCLICPIGHTGWAQVDIAQTILNCWGKTRHLPDPRPDLVEYQEQTEAIHLFLRTPNAVKRLEQLYRTRHSQHLIASFKPGQDAYPIEFTNGHIQLNWEKDSWIVGDWKGSATHPQTWIQPEENLLSA